MLLLFENNRLKRLARLANIDWLVISFLLLLSISLWIPFGFNISCYSDGTFMLAFVERGVSINLNEFRPFTFLPWWLGHVLYPENFIGVNIVFFFLLWMRGIFVYLILKKLRMRPIIAAASSALALVYPADAGFFFVGAINIHMAVVLFLVAIYLLFQYATIKPRWYILLLMWLALALSVSSYEAGYPLIVFSPLVLLLFHLPFRKFIGLTILWYAVPLLNVVRVFVAITANSTVANYQNGLLQNSTGLADVLRSIVNTYTRSLYIGWRLGTLEATTWTYVFLALAAGLISICVYSFLIRRETHTANRKEMRFYFVVALVGFVVIGIGFMAYLPTALNFVAFRTHLYSSLGAALFVVTVLWMFCALLPLKRIVFVSLISMLIGLATLHLLNQHAEFATKANIENAVVLKVVNMLPELKPNTTVLIVDDSPNMMLSQVFPSSNHVDALIQMAYKDYSLRGGVCYLSGGMWGTGYDESCEFDSSGVAIHMYKTRSLFLKSTYDHLVVLRYQSGGSLIIEQDINKNIEGFLATPIYHPENLYNANGIPPLRAKALFQPIRGLATEIP
jgi:hypothetical protein